MFYFLLKSSVFGREKYFSTYAFEIRSLPLFFVLCFFALFWFFFFFVNRILSALSLLMDLRYHRPVTDIEISGAIENLCLGKQLLRCKRVLHDREKIIAQINCREKKAFAVEISVLTIIATEVQRHLSRRRCKECMKFYEFYVQTRLRCNEYESDEHYLSSNENKVWKNPGQYGI